MRSFEGALSELKIIVEKLESGGSSLEESLSAFEKGVELIAFCHKKLEDVRKKIEILTEGTDGEIIRKEFDSEE